VCQVRIAFLEINVYEAAFGVLFSYLKIDPTRWQQRALERFIGRADTIFQ
jgi:hypothetical protein